MNKTEQFHIAKSELESALIDFIKCALNDDRDAIDELNEAMFNSCKEAGYASLEVIEK